MAKIYYHINQYNTSVQYFAILHVVRDTYNTKATFTLTFIRKNKRGSALRQKTFVARHTPIVGRQNHCVLRQKKIIQTIKQLLHQYHKILALCIIK